MDCLIRPTSGRLLTGVAVGIAEMYGLSVALVRLLFVAAFLAQPLVLLIYLLLAISIPGEDSVVAHVHVSGPLRSTRATFEQTSDILVNRVLRRKSRVSPQAIAFLTVAIAAALEIPRLEGIDFYSAHPIVASLGSASSRFGMVIFDLVIAAAFLIPSVKRDFTVGLRMPLRDQIELQESPFKSVGGLASGIGEVLGIDPAYVRVVLILLNLFTFGIVGVIYLIIVVILRKRAAVRSGSIAEADQENSRDEFVMAFRPLIALLFLALAILRVCTEFRIFFFNEPFFQGLAYIAIGLLFAAQGISERRIVRSLWLIGGAAILLVGVESFCMAVFRVQLTLTARFEVTYLIAGLSLIYYSLIEFEGARRSVGILLAAIIGCVAVIIEAQLIPGRFLMALVQFYDFFFPLIFGGLGLWLVMER